MATFRATFKLGLWAFLALSACTSTGEQGGPRLSGLRFDGSAEASATVLLFQVDFSSDADVSAGGLQPYINDAPSGDDALPMRDLLLQNNLPLDARSGTLRFVLEVKLSQETPPQAGSRFDVGFVMKDGTGRSSNRPTATLEISY